MRPVKVTSESHRREGQAEDGQVPAVVLAAVVLTLVVLAVVVAATVLLRVALFLATLGPRFFVTRLALALLLPGPLTIYAPCAPRCRSGPVPDRPFNLESRQVAMAGLEQQHVPRRRTLHHWAQQDS